MIIIKKVACVALIMSLIALLVACGGENVSSPAKSSIIHKKPISNHNEDSDYPTYEEVALKYPGKTVLTMVTPLCGYTPDYMDALNDKLITLGKEYVVYIDQTIIQYNEGDYDNEINKRIAEGTSIDLLNVGDGYCGGTYKTLTEKWLIELDDFLQGEGAPIVDALGPDIIKACQVNGHIYGLSSYITSLNSYAYYVNKDLLDKYGITEDELAQNGPEDLADMFKKISSEEDCAVYYLFRAKDDFCEGYYKADPYRFFGGERSIAISMLADGSDIVVNLFENEDYVRWIKAINNYIKLGYSEGESSFFIYDGYYSDVDTFVVDQTMNAIQKKYPNVQNIAIVPYEQMTMQSMDQTITGVCVATRNEAYSKDFLKETYTNADISNILTYGPEGTYEIMDGRVVYKGEDGRWEESSEYNSTRSWGNCLINYRASCEPENKEIVIPQMLKNMRKTAQMGLYIDISEFAKQTQLIRKICTNYEGLYYGEYDDVDSTLAKLNEELKAAGIDEVVATLNKRINELK